MDAMMGSDTTFITNEKGNKLFNRFNEIFKDTKLFDCLVGYFYVSGFYKLKSNALKRVIITNDDETTEIDFYRALKFLKADIDEKPVSSDQMYYEYLSKNLKEFENLFSEDMGGQSLSRNENKILNI